jgi:lipopolysaccharide transport system ATP-binding protein
MGESAVEIAGIGKRYRIGLPREPYGRLTESIATSVRARTRRVRGLPEASAEWFWALDDVSFNVDAGSVIGIIGRNGAGKTTLLKILAGVTEPTTGRAVMHGRVGSLLEVGTGFHPELTGRENIYLSGSILGMRRKEIARRFDEIVEFAGVERFLDTPVKRYSSGMYVRLGFAVAAHLEAEILIIDEVLAVGDVAFQKKCLSKMEGISHEGRTVLFVSHNMPAVESLCTSGVLLQEGRVAAVGTAREVVDRYLETATNLGTIDLTERRDRQGDGRLRFTQLDTTLRTGNPSEFRIGYEAEEPLHNVDVAISIFSSRGEGAGHLFTGSTGQTFDTISERGTFVCRIPDMPMIPGSYLINLYSTVNGVISDWVIEAATIDVAEGDFFGTGRLPPPGYGSVLVSHDWKCEDVDAAA